MRTVENLAAMARTVEAPIDEHDLERALLRKGVGALAAGRHRCDDCGRTPLAGEQVHLYPPAGGGAGRDPASCVVCELCRALRRTVPEATRLVRHSEHGLTVKLRRIAAPHGDPQPTA